MYEDCENNIVDIDEKDMTLIGLYCAEARRTIINPKSSESGQYSKSYRLARGDKLFLIAYEKPELSQHL